MSEKLLFIFLFALLASCSAHKPVKAPSSAVPMIQSHINAVQDQYAPDKRTAHFQVEVQDNVLTGETNMPAAKAALLERLKSAAVTFTDKIQVLPEAELNGKHHGVITISVANLRSNPRHSAELATQATLGTPVKVWKKQNSWYLVQTPDEYLAWVDGGGITLMDSTDLNKWQQAQKLLYTSPYGFAYAVPDGNGATVSDLVYGDVVILKNKGKEFYEVGFPDGRSGYIPATEAIAYKEWIATRYPTEENLAQTSKRLLGLPYMWGGTSFKGVDCSGFTKTVFFMNGLVLPRDASQQINHGELINTSDGWQNLRPGDLLFFGEPAQGEKPERVVHVGIWLGENNEFIHSAGRVRVNSMNPDAPNHDASELKRFLRAKRISPAASLLDLRKASLYE
jgi:gamma-D-glutamyl-L-lysine dipeptidyl-peptidase